METIRCKYQNVITSSHGGDEKLNMVIQVENGAWGLERPMRYK